MRTGAAVSGCLAFAVDLTIIHHVWILRLNYTDTDTNTSVGHSAHVLTYV